MTVAPTLAATVIGEALIDLVPSGAPGAFVAVPGGSPFNVAVGAARLGVATSLLARLADNAFGRILRERAVAERLDLSGSPLATEPTTLAVVSSDAEARPSYDFYFEGTADWQWSDTELAGWQPSPGIFHFGSIASWTAPGAAAIARLVTRVAAAGTALITYDPNVRPSLLERATAAASVESSVASADLVKASTEDLEWLYAGRSPGWVTDRWLGLGAAAVVVTDGPGGATARTSAGADVAVPGRAVAVVDTVGAGDAFMSGLIASLLRHGVGSRTALLTSGERALEAAVRLGVLTSSITCGRAAADPPRWDELPAEMIPPSPTGGA